MKLLTKQEIQEASKKAVRGFHLPEGWNKESLESAMRNVIKSREEFVPNAVRNKVEIKEAIKLAGRKKK